MCVWTLLHRFYDFIPNGSLSQLFLSTPFYFMCVTATAIQQLLRKSCHQLLTLISGSVCLCVTARERETFSHGASDRSEKGLQVPRTLTRLVHSRPSLLEILPVLLLAHPGLMTSGFPPINPPSTFICTYQTLKCPKTCARVCRARDKGRLPSFLPSFGRGRSS